MPVYTCPASVIRPPGRNGVSTSTSCKQLTTHERTIFSYLQAGHNVTLDCQISWHSELKVSPRSFHAMGWAASCSLFLSYPCQMKRVDAIVAFGKSQNGPLSPWCVCFGCWFESPDFWRTNLAVTASDDKRQWWDRTQNPKGATRFRGPGGWICTLFAEIVVNVSLIMSLSDTIFKHINSSKKCDPYWHGVEWASYSNISWLCFRWIIMSLIAELLVDSHFLACIMVVRLKAVAYKKFLIFRWPLVSSM